MTIWTMLGTAVLAAVLAVTLRQAQPSAAMLLSLFVGAVLFWAALSAAWPVLERMQWMLGRFQGSVPFGEVLTKALGISLLTQMAADVCRDSGETSLASKAELAGKVMLLVCGMPLFEYAVEMLERVVRGEAVGL